MRLDVMCLAIARFIAVELKGCITVWESSRRYKAVPSSDLRTVSGDERRERSRPRIKWMRKEKRGAKKAR